MFTKQYNIVTEGRISRFLIGFPMLGLFASFGAKTQPNVKSDVVIHQITQSFANIYIVKQGDKTVMIDSGNPNKGEILESKLMDIGVNPADIDYLILTHAHPDHAGNAQYLKEKFGIKIVVGSKEVGIVKAQGRDKDLCPRGPMGLLIQRTHAKRKYNEFIPDILIKDDFDLSEIGFKGAIHPIPGHTPGSLYIEMGDAVFVGDLIRGQILNRKKPAYHLFMCNLKDNLQHIKTLATKTYLQRWYPGHGGPLSTEKIKEFINSK
ncbi:MAG: MBL fold metallo-hydrolase [Bacteroidota bacterium]